MKKILLHCSFKKYSTKSQKSLPFKHGLIVYSHGAPVELPQLVQGLGQLQLILARQRSFLNNRSINVSTIMMD
jgi:hypothetical protein